MFESEKRIIAEELFVAGEVGPKDETWRDLADIWQKAIIEFEESKYDDTLELLGRLLGLMETEDELKEARRQADIRVGDPHANARFGLTEILLKRQRESLFRNFRIDEFARVFRDDALEMQTTFLQRGERLQAWVDMVDQAKVRGMKTVHLRALIGLLKKA